MSKPRTSSKACALILGGAVLAGGLLPVTATARSSSAPAASQRGRAVAYVVRSDDGNQDIHVVRPGAEPQGLTQTPEIEGDPEWSPDGTKIAFSKREDVPAGDCCTEYAADIYLMDADGSDLTRLTDHPSNEVAPTWSPNGRRIAFISDRGPDIRPRVFSVRADGTSKRARKLSEIRARDVAWSPRAPVIAITNHGAGDQRMGIRLLDLRTGRARWLTRSSADAWSVDWTGSGEGVAFTLERQNGARLMRIDGGRHRPVPTSGMDTPGWSTYEPAWGPDGTRVAYAITTHANADDPRTEVRMVKLGAEDGDSILATVGAGSYILDVAW